MPHRNTGSRLRSFTSLDLDVGTSALLLPIILPFVPVMIAPPTSSTLCSYAATEVFFI
ncbi:MAG: hypothetical protein ABI415_09860 [Flavitalea sp.]